MRAAEAIAEESRHYLLTGGHELASVLSEDFQLPICTPLARHSSVRNGLGGGELGEEFGGERRFRVDAGNPLFIELFEGFHKTSLHAHHRIDGMPPHVGKLR